MPTLSEYAVAASSTPVNGCLGPDGNMWVCLRGTSKIARITPTGTVDEFACPAGATNPTDICVVGANLWYTCDSGGTSKVVKISTFSGTPTQTAYSITAAYGCCSGPDGNLWVTDAGLNVRKVNPADGTTTATYSVASGSLRSIVSDGTDLFITNRTYSTTGAIVKCTTAGTLTTTACPDASADPAGICWDGTYLYIAAQGVGKIYKVTNGGTQTFTGYTVHASSQITGICAGPRNRIYTAGYNASYNNLYSMPSGGGSITTDTAITTASANAWGVFADVTNCTVWVAEYSGTKVAKWGYVGVPARVPALPKVTVFEPTASPGSFGAYRGFGATVALPDGRLLCLAVKASYHASSDSVVVGKYSSDNGATWDASETSFPEIASCEITVLASGRLAALLDDFGAALRYPEYIYSDDDGASWSTGVVIDWDFASGYAYPSDITELPNGDLLASAYGFDVAASGDYTLRWSKSTDDGATWTPLSTIGSIGGYSVVEPRCAVLDNGDVYAVMHTQDSIPTDYYYAISTDDGATWGTPVLIEAGNSWNRPGLTHFENDNLIVGVNEYSSFTWTYRESDNGGINFNDSVELDTPTATWVPLKSAAVALAHSYGDSQQVGFTYSEEALDQQQAKTYYRQWSGVDGTIVNPKILEAATETDAAQVLSIAAPAGGSLGLLLTKVG